MKFDAYDPAVHGENDWAEVDAATAHEAAVKYMTANADPLRFDPEGVFPILVRRDGGDWEARAVDGPQGDAAQPTEILVQPAPSRVGPGVRRIAAVPPHVVDLLAQQPLQPVEDVA